MRFKPWKSNLTRDTKKNNNSHHSEMEGWAAVDEEWENISGVFGRLKKTRYNHGREKKTGGERKRRGKHTPTPTIGKRPKIHRPSTRQIVTLRRWDGFTQLRVWALKCDPWYSNNVTSSQWRMCGPPKKAFSKLKHPTTHSDLDDGDPSGGRPGESGPGWQWISPQAPHGAPRTAIWSHPVYGVGGVGQGRGKSEEIRERNQYWWVDALTPEIFWK